MGAGTEPPIFGAQSYLAPRRHSSYHRVPGRASTRPAEAGRETRRAELLFPLVLMVVLRPLHRLASLLVAAVAVQVPERAGRQPQAVLVVEPVVPVSTERQCCSQLHDEAEPTPVS